MNTYTISLSLSHPHSLSLTLFLSHSHALFPSLSHTHTHQTIIYGHTYQIYVHTFCCWRDFRDEFEIILLFADTVPDSEVASRRRANSLTSLADPGCCYGNSLGPQTNQVSTDSAEPQLHRFSHKRSSSCSSADSLKKVWSVD